MSEKSPTEGLTTLSGALGGGPQTAGLTHTWLFLSSEGPPWHYPLKAPAWAEQKNLVERYKTH